MRILMAHNYYNTLGGEDNSFEAEAALLESKGHHVVRYVRRNAELTQMSNLQIARRAIWSSEDYARVREVVSREGIDILHVQNFFPQISPAVFSAARSAGAAVVQSLRNYRLLCVNGLFFRNGNVCQECAPKAFAWPGVLHACYRNSRAASASVATMSLFHRLRGTWSNEVDKYIALTSFTKNEFVAQGFDESKIIVKPNFVNVDPGQGKGSGGYAIFVGRLSPEKGVRTVIESWKDVPPSLQLKIVGEGPLERDLRSRAAGDERIEFLGHRALSDVLKLIGEARFLVFPSVWFETFGRVAIEAYAKGTPVIAASIGAVAEVVEDGVTGYLFQPGNSRDLAEKIHSLVNDDFKLQEFRRKVRRIYEDRYSADSNYDQLISIYQRAIESRSLPTKR